MPHRRAMEMVPGVRHLHPNWRCEILHKRGRRRLTLLDGLE